MKRLAALALVGFVAGCASAPVRRAPDLGVPLPERFADAEETGPSSSGDWWTTFEDPALDTLVGMARTENRDLAAAVARLDRAIAQARISGADLEPGISAGLNASRQKQNFIGFPDFGAASMAPTSSPVASTTSSRVGLSLETSWEVDLWGRVRAGARASLAEMQATEADLRGVELSITAQTAKTWFAVLEAAAQVRLAEVSVASFRSVSEQVRSRFEQGIRPALDLRLALSNLAGSEALLHLRHTELALATRQLEVLLGRYPSGKLLERFPAAELPPVPAPPPVGLPAELVSRRPDLAAAERRLAAADQRLVQSQRALYPRLSLSAGGGTAAEELSDLLDGDFGVWNLVANLTQPLFQGGRLRAGVDLAEATREEAVAGFGGAALRAFAEVENALTAGRLLADRERALAETAEQLTAARRLAEERYTGGLGGYIVVLEAQTRALTAESELLLVRRQLLDNRVDLHLALGGGFEVSSVAEDPDEPADRTPKDEAS